VYVTRVDNVMHPMKTTTGKVVWIFLFGADYGLSMSVSAIASDGTVYIGAYAGVFALDGDTGKVNP
jgi:outer membrane protein assembly factor BamB